MIENAIAELIVQTENGQRIAAEELLKNISREELYDFIVRLIKYNPDLSNAVLLEFSHKLGGKKEENKYSFLIRDGLKAMVFDYDDIYYSEYEVDIDILDQWFEKAEQYLTQKKASEAVLIVQACIEEFAEWLEHIDFDTDYISNDYQSRPFEILEKAAQDPEIKAKDIYDYCMSEMSKEKYAGLTMFDEFNRVLMRVSAEVDPDAFIALQYSLLNKLQDKSSYKAGNILQRIVDFYNNCQQTEKAWKCIEENIQIQSFRKMIVENNIEKNNLAEAKKLIRNFIDPLKADNRSYSKDWDDYILEIARREKDIPTMREISYSLLTSNFKEQYYHLYKSTFSAEEWVEEYENLLDDFENKRISYFDYVPKLLIVEGNTKRLMTYIEKKLSISDLERYYQHFAFTFPEKTLALFRKAIDMYAEKNVGRNHYEHIVALFGKMSEIPGGDAVAADMKAYYRVRYKTRRAMIETLNRT
jgi:hypothetical protein